MKFIKIKMISAFSLLLIQIFNSCTYAQITFEKTIGGAQKDYGYDVIITEDGGFLICGLTYSYGAGENDCYLVKTDNYGEVQWEKTYGGASYEYALKVKETNDGGYLLGGTTLTYGEGSNDYYLIKTDNNGNSQWEKTYGGWNVDVLNDMEQTSDGGYILIGKSQSFTNFSSCVYMIKTDQNGDTLFTKKYGGPDLNWGLSIEITNDNGYIICGKTSSFGAGGQDVYLIRTNESGDTLWTKTYGGDTDDWGNDIIITDDNGFVIAGTTNYDWIDENGDVYVLKTDPEGIIEWEKTYSYTQYEFANRIIKTSDNGFMLVGATNSFGAGEYDLYFLKTDANGDTLWTKTYGYSDREIGYSVKQPDSGGYILTGYTNSIGNGDYDIYLIKTDEDGNVQNIMDPVITDNTINLEIYPNPCNDYINIKINNPDNIKELFLEILNINGQVIYRNEFHDTQEEIDMSGFSKGVYTVKVIGENYILNKKMIVY